MLTKQILFLKNVHKPKFVKLVLISLVLPLLLAACGGNDKNKKKIVVKEEDKSIVLSPSGVGPINATTTFNMHQMTIAFSDFSVIEEVNYHLGSPYPVIRISDGAKTLMVINPDHSHKSIFSILIEDNLIVNSLGHRLGTNYSDIYASKTKAECQLGSADNTGKMVCYAPNYANILYIFNGKGKSDKAPSVGALNSWGLESIIWRPISKS